MPFSETINEPTYTDVPASTGFSDFFEESRGPLPDGWYQGVIVAERTRENEQGNTETFPTEDSPSKDGSSRNINLQVKVTTKETPPRTWTPRIGVNYRAIDLDTNYKTHIKQLRDSGDQMGKSDNRSAIALGQLARLERIAGAPLQVNGNGGFDLTPLVGKTIYVRRGDETDKRNNRTYKAVVEFNATTPKTVTALNA